MPIPTPAEGERETEFVIRCMADETMQDEYPDSGQRYAVCESHWGDKNQNEEN